MRLNTRQQQAVDAISGPVLVLAGAGSGKTAVITHKINYLVNKCHYQPDSIAAVTFTNKAAKEMRERLIKTLGEEAGSLVRTSTFHTLGMAILRSEIQHLGRTARFSIFDEQDSLKVLNDLTEKQIKGDKQQLYLLKNRISDWKNASLSADEVLKSAKDQNIQFYAAVYRAYDEHLDLCNALDFDDLIALSVRLLRDNPAIREKWQNKIRYLLVDEYQDTNEAQYQMVKLLAGADPRFTVVGDDDQSIYAWRGAKPENLQQLKADYPNLEVVMLEQNYRCCGRVLRVANELIANNSHIFDKKLWSDHHEGDLIRVMQLDDEEVEAEWVVSDLIANKLATKRLGSDYAILYRGNHQAKFFEKQLIQHRIPYQMSGGQSFFARSEIRDLMAYFRLVSNPDDDAACQRIINVPRRAIGSKTLQTIARRARDTKQSLFKTCQQVSQIAELGLRAKQAVDEFVALITKASNQSPFDVDWFVRELSYDHWLMESSSTPKAAEYRWNNVKELCRWISDGLEQHDDNDLNEVINQLLIKELQQQEEASGSVQLMTLHAAKGLEFAQVYLVGMEEDLLPHKTSIEEDTIEEERRLLYVGITRAKQNLILTMADRRRRYGETTRCDVSRFLAELPESDLDWPDQKAPLTETEQQDQNQFYRDQLAALLSSD